MQTLPVLKIGDEVEIIAPASRCTEQQLNETISLLSSWKLKCLVADDMFGDDLLCANNDENRFKALHRALTNKTSKAIIGVRGGYGCMRLLPGLLKMTPPVTPKLFVGMSDLTAINLYLQQNWQWPILHGALAPDKFSLESISMVKSVLFADCAQLEYVVEPLNAAARRSFTIPSTITGGNLTLVQASIGTNWQIKVANKILFLEEVGERGYKIDRMLEHLRQANIFMKAQAILLGDFLGGNEPNGSSLILPVLQRFAQTCEIPVVTITGIGHGSTNYPLPLGTKAQLKLGEQAKLTCSR